MTAQIYWLVDKRILLLKPMGEITEAAIQDNFARVQSMLEGIESSVYLIVDSTEQHTVLSPSVAKKLAGVLRENMRAGIGDNVAWTILITNNVLMRFVTSLLVQWLGSKMRAFDSIQEALQFLMERDITLPSDIKTHININP